MANLISKNEAIKKLKQLTKDLHIVEMEVDKAWKILKPRAEKILKDEHTTMEDVVKEDQELKKLKAQDIWRKDLRNCIDYIFEEKESREEYKQRADSIDFSILGNMENREGFKNAEKLIDDMIAEVEEYWPIKKSNTTSFILTKVVPGLIVSAIAIFFFTPLKEIIFPDKKNSKHMNHKNSESIEPTANSKVQNENEDSVAKSKINIENMSGGVAIGNVENLNVHQNISPPRDPNWIYKEGIKWGTVVNFKVENSQKNFAIDKIEFDKPIRNINDLFTPFEYREFIIKIEKIETVVQMMPPSAEGINGKIIGSSKTE